MNDRELLEMAAKALDDPKLFANNTGAPWQYWIGFCEEMQCDVTRLWNPLDDDGDALRLAYKLGMQLDFDGVGSIEAVRRDIVRAAAACGRSMP